jgi:hypothetical protein
MAYGMLYAIHHRLHEGSSDGVCCACYTPGMHATGIQGHTTSTRQHDACEYEYGV